MKNSIKQKPKKDNSTANKHTRPFTTNEKGYKEEVYNSEQQKTYNQSDEAKNNTKNTAGPKS